MPLPTNKLSQQRLSGCYPKEGSWWTSSSLWFSSSFMSVLSIGCSIQSPPGIRVYLVLNGRKFSRNIFAREEIFPLIHEIKFCEINQNSPFGKINSVKVYIFLLRYWLRYNKENQVKNLKPITLFVTYLAKVYEFTFWKCSVFTKISSAKISSAKIFLLRYC